MKEFNCDKRCGKCCQSVSVSIGQEEDLDMFDWLKAHQNCEVFKKDATYYVKFNTPCNNLVDGLCKIYATRPFICKIYDCGDKFYEHEGGHTNHG